jgi:hypothetical protein
VNRGILILTSIGIVGAAMTTSCASARQTEAGAGAATPVAPATVPRLILMRGEWLAESKRRLAAGDGELRPAFDALLDSARAALAAPALSVMQKRRMPPSGDKHDYMSLAPYWWPDPTKPNGLPFIRRDGEMNPESRVDHDGTRLQRTISNVEALALAWYFTGDPKYATRAAGDLRVFFLDSATRMNPNLNFGQAVLGVNDGRGTGIIDTRTLPQLVDAVRLLDGAPGWTAGDRDGMVAWSRDYLRWLLESPHGRDEQAATNNHGTFYDAQVAALALFVGDSALARRTIGVSATARLAAQVKPDGAQPLELERTRPLHYSLFNLDAYTMLAEMGAHLGIDLWGATTPSGGNLSKALLYIAPYADRSKPWPTPQVSPAGADDFLASLRRGASALGGSAADSLRADLRLLPVSLRSIDRSRLAYPEVP